MSLIKFDLKAIKEKIEKETAGGNSAEAWDKSVGERTKGSIISDGNEAIAVADHNLNVRLPLRIFEAKLWAFALSGPL
jgi:hypothetical protein